MVGVVELFNFKDWLTDHLKDEGEDGDTQHKDEAGNYPFEVWNGVIISETNSTQSSDSKVDQHCAQLKVRKLFNIEVVNEIVFVFKVIELILKFACSIKQNADKITHR